ncbi:hypothetical protein [Marinobacter sp. MBR-105]
METDLYDEDEKQYSSAVEQADKAFRAQLNYGGIRLDATQPLRPGVSRPIMFDWQSGDLPDEIGQMRRLATAFNSLADALEDRGIDCSERLPTKDDADEHGFVEWLRSGQWLLGLWQEKPVDATRWRCMSARV